MKHCVNELNQVARTFQSFSIQKNKFSKFPSELEMFTLSLQLTFLKKKLSLKRVSFSLILLKVFKVEM